MASRSSFDQRLEGWRERAAGGTQLKAITRQSNFHIKPLKLEEDTPYSHQKIPRAELFRPSDLCRQVGGDISHTALRQAPTNVLCQRFPRSGQSLFGSPATQLSGRGATLSEVAFGSNVRSLCFPNRRQSASGKRLAPCEDSKSALKSNRIPSLCRSIAAMRVASIELPPSSKKSSSTPTRSTFRISAAIQQSAPPWGFWAQRKTVDVGLG